MSGRSIEPRMMARKITMSRGSLGGKPGIQKCRNAHSEIRRNLEFGFQIPARCMIGHHARRPFMGLFKSKEERRIEREMKIRQGMKAIERSIRQQERFADDFIKNAQHARKI